jgi:hypothetical protein
MKECLSVDTIEHLYLKPRFYDVRFLKTLGPLKRSCTKVSGEVANGSVLKKDDLEAGGAWGIGLF